MLLTHYHHSGPLGDVFTDRGRRHLVIELPRAMHRGETLAFAVTRQTMVEFTSGEEWLETTIDHPVLRLRRAIMFPRSRPCRRASFHVGNAERPLPITLLSRGRTLVQF